VQRELREVPGCTVLIYDQTCAAEKRRRRKRGSSPTRPRVFINDEVCEGCGDCGAAVNCVSVSRSRPSWAASAHRPEQLQQGLLLRERLLPELRHGAAARRQEAKRGVGRRRLCRAARARPAAADRSAYGILVTGIGGTGVITVGALLGMAAHLEGKGCSSST
jgi:indolepyruvate ferredoxin oxidoreductase